MSESIKAIEARQMAKDSSRIIAETELAEVYELIRKACSNGNYEVMYEKDLSTHALRRLEELGYKYDMMKPGIRINWYETK